MATTPVREETPLRRRRALHWTAAATAAVVAGCAIAAAGGGTAGAATLPQAQSVGNFLDATLGGQPLDAVAKLDYAKAVAPGSDGVQNPLDVSLLKAIDLPLTGALQLPKLLGIDLGAVTQKAEANVNGTSYGQAGAALDAGGVSVGGSTSTDEAGSATINLSGSGLASGTPLAGGGAALDALGSVKATIGGVSAVASTPKGYGKAGATNYQIANVDLTVASPLLGGVLGTVTSTLNTALSPLLTTFATTIGQALPPECKLTTPTDLTEPISLEGGAIVIDPSTGGLTISLDKLLKQLGLNLNSLPANTDLIDYLLSYLTDPNGLAKGLESVVNGLVDPLQAQFASCAGFIKAIPVVGPGLYALVSPLLTTTVQTTIEKTLSGLVADLVNATGANPLAPLATGLKQLLDIGVNVQPNGKAGPSGKAFVDPLAATPKQGTDVVKGQTIVRAIEVNVAAAAGAAIPSTFAAPRAAAAGSTGILTLALANAAAGPSTAAAVATTSPAPSTSAPGTTTPATDIPTGVPAGAAPSGGTPVLPIVLVLVALAAAGGGLVTYRVRGVKSH